MDNQKKTPPPPPVGTGPGSSGIENADLDRDVTGDAEIDKSAEAPGHNRAKTNTTDPDEKENGDAASQK